MPNRRHDALQAKSVPTRPLQCNYKKSPSHKTGNKDWPKKVAAGQAGVNIAVFDM